MEIQACVEGEVEGGQEKEHGRGEEGVPLSEGMVRGPEGIFQNLFASNQGAVHGGDGDDIL